MLTHLPRRAALTSWLIAAIFATLPLVALGATSSYGNNYSFESNNGTGNNVMTTCDTESDSDNAFSDFSTVSSGSLRLTDSNGSSGGCGQRTVYSAITGHVTCEDHDWAPDGCGYWVAATT